MAEELCLQEGSGAEVVGEMGGRRAEERGEKEGGRWEGREERRALVFLHQHLSGGCLSLHVCECECAYI